jgi:vacuolar-type H+-ATPase subunit I/STV1
MPQLEAIVLLEHQKLSNENPLLKEQVKSLEVLNQLYEKTDSLQKEEIKTYEYKVASDEKKIQRLETTQKKLMIVSSVGGIVLFILGLIL